MRLNDRRFEAVDVCGHTYRLRLTLKNVLTAMDIAGDELLEDDDKAMAMLRLLVRWPRPHRGRAKVQLLESVMGHIRGEESPSGGPDIVDLSQDAGLIRASFLQAYGIDLEKTDIHWDKFIELFQALPDDTAMGRVMAIRSTPIPKATQYNKETREALARAKRAVALKKTVQSAQKSADALASSILAMLGRR